MRLIVTSKQAIAEETVQVRLERPDGGALAAAAPGAHVEITMGEYVRRYSLISSPIDTTHYEVAVLRARSGRGGSAYVHDSLAVGDVVVVAAPVNGFPLDLGAPHSVFVAGGIGITPFYSMAAALSAAGRSFALHYAVRSQSRQLPLERLGLGTFVYSSDAPGPRLDLPRLFDSVQPEVPIYVCGPPRMISMAVALAHAQRPWRRLYTESFGYAPQPTDRVVTLRLERSQLSIEVSPGTSLLDALLARDMWLPSECRRGECGTCVADIFA